MLTKLIGVQPVSPANLDYFFSYFRRFFSATFDVFFSAIFDVSPAVLDVFFRQFLTFPRLF